MPLRATESHVQAALRYIEQLGFGGSTCPQRGLEAALEIIRKSALEEREIHFYGSGSLSCPGTSARIEQSAIFEKVRVGHQEGIRVDVIGMGDWLNFDFLLPLAEENGGTFRRLE